MVLLMSAGCQPIVIFEVKELANFKLSECLCSEDSDRDFVYESIRSLYGSESEFEAYVRTSLRNDLMGKSFRWHLPRHLMLLVLLPYVAASLDPLTSLVVMKEPVKTIILRFIAGNFSVAT